MSRRKKGVYAVVGSIAVIGLLYYFIFSSSAILKNVSHHRGYHMQVAEDPLPIELFIESQMYSIKEGEQKIINKVMHNEHHTKIILEDVFFREEYLHFNFTTEYDLPFLEGGFLYNGVLQPRASITPYSGFSGFEAKTANNELLQIGQIGSGPNSDFSFSLYQPPMELLQDGFTVRYDGLYLHEYQLKWK